MNPWGAPLATKGCIALDVFTLTRALSEGLLGPPVECDRVESLRDDARGETFKFILHIKPDGSDPFPMLTANEASVRLFISEMAPHTLRILVDAGESEESVRAAIEGKLQ